MFANTTASLSDDSQFPLGYRRDTLPNPELMQPNPCYTVDLTVNGTDRAYIELAVSCKLLHSVLHYIYVYKFEYSWNSQILPRMQGYGELCTDNY